MKKLSLLMAICILLCSILLPASASEIESISPNAYENPIACPYCGALGYPTGKVTVHTVENIAPRLFSFYHVYQCSADSSHTWEVYIGDALT